MKVEVLGPGCQNCEELKENAEEAAEEMIDLKVKIEEVKDPAEIASRGVMGTPALEVDGEVVFSGRVPSKSEIKEALE